MEGLPTMALVAPKFSILKFYYLELLRTLCGYFQYQLWNLIRYSRNKGLNYKSSSIPVLQIDKLTGEIINEHLGCKEAAEVMNCSPENIRRACVGKSKSAKGYKWKYKHETKN